MIATARTSLRLTVLALGVVVVINVMLVCLPVLNHLVFPEATGRCLSAFNRWLRASGPAILAGAIDARWRGPGRGRHTRAGCQLAQAGLIMTVRRNRPRDPTHLRASPQLSRCAVITAVPGDSAEKIVRTEPQPTPGGQLLGDRSTLAGPSWRKTAGAELPRMFQ